CSPPRRVVFLLRILADLAARKTPEHVRVFLEGKQVRILVEALLVIGLKFHGPSEVLDDLGLVAEPGRDPSEIEMRTRARRFELQRSGACLGRAFQVAR